MEFGLIGRNIQHSASPAWWTDFFRKQELQECSYGLFDLDHIDRFPELLATRPHLSGLNVTIPYKEAVMPYLDEVDEVAAAIGAVNTIRISDGKTKGFNTDAEGFRRSIRPFLDTRHQRALIFGTGGASRAVRKVLEELGLGVHLVSRRERPGVLSYEALVPEVFSACKMLVNCTPVGTAGGHIRELPFDHSNIGSDHFVVDLVYNPPMTHLLLKAQGQGAMVLNGQDMLRFQALEAAKIWGLLRTQ